MSPRECASARPQGIHSTSGAPGQTCESTLTANDSDESTIGTPLQAVGIAPRKQTDYRQGVWMAGRGSQHQTPLESQTRGFPGVIQPGSPITQEAAMTRTLSEVFGINTHVRPASYVDRGALDARFSYLLTTERHIAIHGDSKQGKSWLRDKALAAEATLVVQTRIDSTPETLIQEALGLLGLVVEIERVEGREVQGRLNLAASSDVGIKFLAKARGELDVEASVAKTREVTTQAVGQNISDLAWVASVIQASGKRFVIEDFHYASENQRRRFAFLLKALGEYGVPAIVVGVWAQDHLLTYYNGDLTGRVEDIRLQWTDAELHDVLRKGSAALNIEFSPSISDSIVRDAYENVGLLQQVTERLCLLEGVTEEQASLLKIDSQQSLDLAKRQSAESMQGRYTAFADNFVRGMRRMSEGLEVYKHLLRSFTAASDLELLNGIDSADLLGRIDERSDASIRQGDLTQALERVDRLQSKINVTPPVITYDRDGRRVRLVDRTFLFYRNHRERPWPWDEDGFAIERSNEPTLEFD